MNLENSLSGVLVKMEMVAALLEKYEEKVDSHSTDLASLRSEVRMSREIVSKEMEHLKNELSKVKEDCRVCKFDSQKEKIDSLKEEKQEVKKKGFNTYNIIFTAIMSIIASLAVWFLANLIQKIVLIMTANPGFVKP